MRAYVCVCRLSIQDLLRQLEVVAQKSEMATKLIEEAGKERAKVEEQQALAEIEKEKSAEIAAKANAYVSPVSSYGS